MLAAVMAEAGGARIGVVAIGRNEGERLRRCLASIDVPGAPVVYVDSGSTDGSSAMAAGVGAIVAQVDMTVPFTAARARNVGFKVLLDRYPGLDYVQFVDGDCEFERDWIAAATYFLDLNEGTAIVCGRRRERFPQASFYNALMDEEWNTPLGSVLACGGDALVRTRVLRATGGYDPAMIAHEEPEFCYRVRALGMTIERIDRPMTVHDAQLHALRPWLRRSMRAGYGYSQAASRSQAWTPEVKMLLRASFWALAPLASLLLFVLGLGVAGMIVVSAMAALLVRFYVRTARAGKSHPARRVALSTLAKVAEFAGALKFLRTAAVGRSHRAIYYR